MGEWEGRASITPPDGSDPSVATTMSKVRLILNADGTFVLIQMGLPREGDALYNADHVKLRILKFVDRPVGATSSDAARLHPDLTVRLQQDGSLILEDPSEMVGRTIRLVRQVK